MTTSPTPSNGSIYGFEQIQELKSTVKQIKLILSSNMDEPSEDSDDCDDEGSVSSNDSHDADNYNVCEEIEFSTNCLTKLRPSLEQNLLNANRRNVLNMHPPLVPFCLSGPASFYVSAVREKYELAGNLLVERLGEANWQRHLRVRNRVDQSNIPAEEEVGSIFRPISNFHDSGIGTSVPAQTQYAPSHTSFISSNTEEEKGTLRVPPLPAEAGDGKPFQCLVCGLSLSNIHNRVDWK